jgi:hypothetical protein
MKSVWLKYLLFTVAFGAAVLTRAQTCGAPGLAGPVTLASGFVNRYYPATASVAAGSRVISVGTATGAAGDVAPGDLVLVIQMQDGVNNANLTPGASITRSTTQTVQVYGNNFGTAGRYEYGRVCAFAAGSITLCDNLVNSYSQATTAGNARQTFQVVRVPQYASATVAAGTTITPTRWDGTSGGIVAIDVAGNLTLNGTLNASGYGFRGGGGYIASGAGSNTNTSTTYTLSQNNGAVRGEGSAGTPRRTRDGAGTNVAGGTELYPNGDLGWGSAGNAGGGGNDGDPANNDENSGGGGGSGAGSGGQGGNSWNSNLNVGGRGGKAFTPGSGVAIMGGGGGAGTTNNGNTAQDFTYSGGAGGGLVMVRTGSVSGAGSVTVSGLQAPTPSASCCDDGAGGGGGGGSVVFLASNATGLSGIRIDAQGGRGADTPTGSGTHGPGGGGGGGAYRTNGAVSGSSSVAGGANGMSGASAFSATAGNAGSAASTASFTESAGTRPGASCLPQLTVLKSTTTPTVTLPGQATARYVISVSNPATNSGAAYGVAIGDPLPVPFGLATTTTAATTTFAGTLTAGPSPSTPNQSGVTSTARFGVTGSANNPTTPSFTIYPGGVITLSFVVNVNTTTLATFQNTATVSFADPTRTTGGAATGTAVVNPAVSPGGTFANGGTVGGSNYASGSSTAEDVTLVATTTLSVTKDNGVTTLASGATTSYTLTFTNSGGFAAGGAIIKDAPSSGLNCTTVTCLATSGGASCPTELPLNAPTAVAAIPNFFNATGIAIPNFPASSSVTLRMQCTVTASGT